MRLLAGAGFILQTHALGEDRRFCTGSQQRGNDSGRTNAGPRAITEQLDQLPDAFRLDRRAQISLVGDTLVIKGQNVGDIGPPFDQLQTQVAVGGRTPQAQFCFQVITFRVEQGQQKGVAKAVEIPDPVGNRIPVGRVADAARVNETGARADWFGVHLPPPRVMFIEPFSGKLGSLSTRMISSTPTSTRSGMSI